MKLKATSMLLYVCTKDCQKKLSDLTKNLNSNFFNSYIGTSQLKSKQKLSAPINAVEIKSDI